MNCGGAQSITRAVQDVAKGTTLNEYAEARAGKCQKMQSSS